jgi:hypothetical protein
LPSPGTRFAMFRNTLCQAQAMPKVALPGPIATRGTARSCVARASNAGAVPQALNDALPCAPPVYSSAVPTGARVAVQLLKEVSD